jgi:outer membrane receptor for ferrienterochelin and colicin
MRLRFSRSCGLFLPVFLVTAGAACHNAVPRAAPSPTDGFVVTAEEIQKSGATTAWEALKLTVPVVSFRGTTRSASGERLRIRRRGPSSLYLNDDPRVFIDQVRIVDISVLDRMPAGDIAVIVVLSGLDGTTYYGTSAVNGVVLISTQAKVPPRQPGENEERR